MKCLIPSLGLALLVGLSACAKTPGEIERERLEAEARVQAAKAAAEEARWYVGGNLHQGTVKQWREASHSNRLATAGDWTTAILSKKAGGPKTPDQVRPFAGELVTCVETSRTSAPDTMKVAELAAACAVLMGW